MHFLHTLVQNRCLDWFPRLRAISLKVNNNFQRNFSFFVNTRWKMLMESRMSWRRFKARFPFEFCSLDVLTDYLTGISVMETELIPLAGPDPEAGAAIVNPAGRPEVSLSSLDQFNLKHVTLTCSTFFSSKFCQKMSITFAFYFRDQMTEQRKHKQRMGKSGFYLKYTF